MQVLSLVFPLGFLRPTGASLDTKDTHMRIKRKGNRAECKRPSPAKPFVFTNLFVVMA